ncbi:MAG: ornithine cyclodeaminase family protein [Candidatus Rokuibacteriota bacterium]
MLVLSRADLEGLLSPGDVIEAMAAIFRLYAEGHARAPARIEVPVGASGVLLVMPAATGEPGASGMAGAKLVSVQPTNQARGHPTLYAGYVLVDGGTGEPLAYLEASYLTGIRTGATSALAARLLARPDARRVACFGTGVQAGFQLACLAAVRPLERVAVVGRDPVRARAFAGATGKQLTLTVEVAGDPRAAVRDADIVTCATTSATPVVRGADLSPGAHLDLVGAFRPDDREADTEALRRARLVVDTYAGALASAGDVLIPLREGAFDQAHVSAELAEVVVGSKPGRTRADEITVFKSVGWALEDLAAARLAYNRARAAGLGTEVHV